MLKKLNDNFKNGINRKLLITSFIVYFVILIWAILFKFMQLDLIKGGYNDLNQTVLYHMRFLITPRARGIKLFLTDIISNLLFFLPLGLYLPLLFKKYNLFRDLLIAFLLSLSFELIEGFSRIGCSDYMDIIENILGTLAGLIIFYFLRFFNSIIKSIKLYKTMI